MISSVKNKDMTEYMAKLNSKLEGRVFLLKI